MSTPQRLPAILVLVAGLIVLLSSVLCLAFRMKAYSSYMEHTTSSGMSSVTVKSSSYGADGWIDLYPQHLMPVTRAPLVVAGAIGLIAGLAVTGLAARCLKTKRVLQLVYWQQIMLIAILGVNALLALVTMIYTLVQHSRSAHFDPGYVMATSAYDHGLFSLEAWTCETPRCVPEFLDHELGIQCVGERASRSLVVVLCFFSLAVLGLLVRDLNTTQTVVAKKKMKNNWEDEGWEW